MDQTDRYLELNKALWNAKTPHHIASDFYQQDEFLQGKSSLNAPELELLGDIGDTDVLHLQCHFGQDTLSLARMGARVTGADLSDKAIDAARELAGTLKLDACFICSDLYSMPGVLDVRFDTVFTSYGVLGWLPDMKRWAQVVSHFLRPGGRLVLVEFHPAVWMFDNDFTRVAYSYFNREAIVEEEEGTYADREAPLSMTAVSWNHSLSEVIQSLLDAGLRLDLFREYDYSPYDCFRNTVETRPGKFHIKGMEEKLPMLYALQATKA